jgi:hypothetical protein
MTLKQLAEELNKHNQDRDINRYKPLQGYTTGWILCKRKNGETYSITKEQAEELLKSFKEGK